MIKQPIPLSALDVKVLAKCSLHYHFRQQKSAVTAAGSQLDVDKLVREKIQALHAAGGPTRLSLRDCLRGLENQRAARQMVERYYHRLETDWRAMIASNEEMELRISLAGVSILLQATIDRLDTTRDGGILAVFFRTEPGPLPSAAELRGDHAMTIYHSLVAATYPLKRPVRLQQSWLQANDSVTIELSEEEYRHNLSDLRDPIQALARGEVMAKPGLHCDVCPFKHHGCPVYAHETDPENQAQEFDSPSPGGKISPRKWIFKI